MGAGITLSLEKVGALNLLRDTRIYILGASGAGATALGSELAKALSLTHVDCDDHFWAKTELPFSQIQELDARIASMTDALGTAGWVLSGDCNGWGAEFVAKADIVVFLTAPADLRFHRLVRREKERFGKRIEIGGDMYETHGNFLAWAAAYDRPENSGRSLVMHEIWLSQQTTPVCRLNGAQHVDVSVQEIISKMLR
ncbi:adenylate kinase family enzyme [Sulfitobacter guttiformis]|uniref:Adenylate kinase family enzyme n=1 Tax=Sulfitobacter guttiformis TaxID=74349 RepID=A0A420DHG2_9RHOB|nr:adenylate kinase family enzyme [Sulfitobacter guttiformis]